jgi:hypothetical protein
MFKKFAANFIKIVTNKLQQADNSEIIYYYPIDTLLQKLEESRQEFHAP